MSFNDWIFDSGASTRCTSQRDIFVGDTRPYYGGPNVGIGGTRVVAERIGTVRLNTMNVHGNPGHIDSELHNVRYSPHYECNLISVFQLVRKGAKCTFSKDGVLLELGCMVVFGEEVDGVYLLPPARSHWLTGRV